MQRTSYHIGMNKVVDTRWGRNWSLKIVEELREMTTNDMMGIHRSGKKVDSLSIVKD